MAARRLTLMRHARQSGLATRDHDRPLTADGRDDAHRVGVRLAALGPDAIPTRVLSSTALRCRETWRSVAAALGDASGIEVSFEAGLYNASAMALQGEIAAADEAVEHLLLLAHNPGISVLGLELAQGGGEDVEALRGGFTPATTAHFEIEGPWSTLAPRTAHLVRFDRV